MGEDNSRPPAGLARRLAGASAGMYGSVALAFIGTVIVARAFGPAEYGTFVLALATATFIGTLLDLTLNQGVVHHGFRLLEAKDIGGLRALIKAALALDFSIGVAITGLMIALAEPIAQIAGSGHLSVTIVQLAALTILGSTIDSTTSAVIILAGRAQVTAYCTALTNGLRLAGALAVLHTGSAEWLIGSYALATALGSGAQAVVAWRVGWRKWQAPTKPVRMRSAARQLIPFAIHSSLTTTVLSATDSVILIFLGQVSGTSAVALFRVALLPQVAAAMATGPTRLITFQDQTMLAAGGRQEELRRDLWRWTRVSALIGLPGAIAGYFLLPVIIPAIYGHKYEGAVSAAQIMLVFAFVTFAVPWTKNFAAIIGRPRVQSVLAGCLVVVALPIMAIFSSNGADAAAAGLSAGSVVFTAGYLLVAHRYFKEYRVRAGTQAPQREPEVPAVV